MVFSGPSGKEKSSPKGSSSRDEAKKKVRFASSPLSSMALPGIPGRESKPGEKEKDGRRAKDDNKMKSKNEVTSSRTDRGTAGATSVYYMPSKLDVTQKPSSSGKRPSIMDSTKPGSSGKMPSNLDASHKPGFSNKASSNLDPTYKPSSPGALLSKLDRNNTAGSPRISVKRDTSKAPATSARIPSLKESTRKASLSRPLMSKVDCESTSLVLDYEASRRPPNVVPAEKIDVKPSKQPIAFKTAPSKPIVAKPSNALSQKSSAPTSARLKSVIPSFAPSGVKTIYPEKDKNMATRQLHYNSLPSTEKAKQDTWAREMLKKTSSCPAGFRWMRRQDGYTCEGNVHTVTDTLLAEGKGGMFVNFAWAARPLKPIRLGPYYRSDENFPRIFINSQPKKIPPDVWASTSGPLDLALLLPEKDMTPADHEEAENEEHMLRSLVNSKTFDIKDGKLFLDGKRQTFNDLMKNKYPILVKSLLAATQAGRDIPDPHPALGSFGQIDPFREAELRKFWKRAEEKLMAQQGMGSGFQQNNSGPSSFNQPQQPFGNTRLTGRLSLVPSQGLFGLGQLPFGNRQQQFPQIGPFR